MNQEELLHQQDLERIKKFRLMDDDFMTKVFDNDNEAVQLVLQIIMEKDDLIVQNVKTQKTITNLRGRGARLDVDACDSSKTQYDIEVQRSDKGASRHRARFNSSVIDANMLPAGDENYDFHDQYVIFITENDVLSAGKPIYHIERIILETSEPFNDGEHIIYVNGSIKDNDTPLGRLMHDFNVSDPDQMYYKILADKTRYFKEDKEGVKTMCKAMEEMRYEEKIRVIISLYKKGHLTLAIAAEELGITQEEVRELAKQTTYVGKVTA